MVPPSQRKGRAYTVFRDTDPIDTPGWLLDLIQPARTTSTYTANNAVEDQELADLMRYVPNVDLSWEKWTNIGLALFVATNGSDFGFRLFDAFSAQSEKYNSDATAKRWEGIKASPPDRTGTDK